MIAVQRIGLRELLQLDRRRSSSEWRSTDSRPILSDSDGLFADRSPRRRSSAATAASRRPARGEDVRLVRRRPASPARACKRCQRRVELRRVAGGDRVARDRGSAPRRRFGSRSRIEVVRGEGLLQIAGDRDSRARRFARRRGSPDRASRPASPRRARRLLFPAAAKNCMAISCAGRNVRIGSDRRAERRCPRASHRSVDVATTASANEFNAPPARSAARLRLRLAVTHVHDRANAARGVEQRRGRAGLAPAVGTSSGPAAPARIARGNAQRVRRDGVSTTRSSGIRCAGSRSRRGGSRSRVRSSAGSAARR